MYRNTKNVPFYIFGKGSFAQLGDLVDERRAAVAGPAVFFVDHFFRGRELEGRLPKKDGDLVLFVDTTNEPTTEQIDDFAAAVRAHDNRLPCTVVAIGGGATLDVGKAAANMLTNPGQAADYQGWDLVKNPAPHKIGVPTLSGTGAECSRTCVLLNAKRGIKLGMNSDLTMYDQLLLDPELTRTVPRDQYFYTGMDTYMHCIESLRGSYRNVIVDALAQKAVHMCEDIFLSNDMMAEENLEKMMIASYLGGMSAGNVGVIHPISAGLSVVLHTHHGIANCHALSVLGEFYPEDYPNYVKMIERQGVNLPKGLCANLSDDQMKALVASSVVHEKPLTNALGPDFRKILTDEKVISLFKAM
ncbi:iron-containing alcohol dehydrogenase family protein [Nitratidesulfovibrio termitidis]|uniref:iron-containing alcohol dehydrogenase family protein n=1 Tax=Nitratidesulfovibrio termitidis TaxID=42252 RepID=UPI0005523866|nr:iron-containing alcohol dehydrogenase family protein [Nitratidesulfovibrio termitidis]